METIQTSTSMKHIYKYHFAKYNINDDVDGIYSLYKICRHLMASKKINTLKKDLGKNYDVVMKRFRAFLPQYELANQYRKMMLDTRSHKLRDEIEDNLRLLCMKMPVINDAVILVFTILVNNSDLRNVPMLSPYVLDKSDNQMQLDFSQEDDG